MRVGFKAINEVDRDGNPAGGEVIGTGFSIVWQQGPLGEVGSEKRREPNGAFVEDVIDAALQRIDHYQRVSGGRFACPENSVALGFLRAALQHLDMRTKRRTEQGIEGTHAEEFPADENARAALRRSGLKVEPVLPHLSMYRCHKEVRAARIETVAPEVLANQANYGAPPFLVLLSDPTYDGPTDDTPMVRVDLPAEWMERHDPEVGGYFVVYKDGYASYSPAEAFIEGYTLVESPEAQVRAQVEEWLASGRCGVCGWTLAKSQAEGCIPGDCSFRSDDPLEKEKLSARRAYLKSVASAPG